MTASVQLRSVEEREVTASFTENHCIIYDGGMSRKDRRCGLGRGAVWFKGESVRGKVCVCVKKILSGYPMFSVQSLLLVSETL